MATAAALKEASRRRKAAMQAEAEEQQRILALPPRELATRLRDMTGVVSWRPGAAPMEVQAIIEARATGSAWSERMPMWGRSGLTAGPSQRRKVSIATEASDDVEPDTAHVVLERRGGVSLCASERERQAAREDEGVLGWRYVDDGRLRFNLGKFSQAARQLRVDWPIQVSWTPGLRSGTSGEPIDGQHIGSSSNPRHQIEIACGLDFMRANDVIWHELAHARQAEIFGSVQELRDLIGDEDVELDAWLRWKNIRLPLVIM